MLLAIILLFSVGISARAETAEIYDYGKERLGQAVPPEAAEILDGSGITPDNNGVTQLSFSGALDLLKQMIFDNIGGPLRLLTALCGVILLCGLSAGVSDGSDKLSSLFTTVGVLAGAGMTVAAVSDVLTDTLELLSSASVFITTFIPLFAGVLSVMGRTASASVINSVTLAATQLFSQLAVNFLEQTFSTTGAHINQFKIMASVIFKVSSLEIESESCFRLYCGNECCRCRIDSLFIVKR